MNKAGAKKASVSCGLILSSGYLSTAQVAEFGRLPPSFLCLANKRLYTWQLRTFPENLDGVYMTLPSDFQMEPFDKQALSDKQINLLSMPASYSVGKAIQEALRQMPANTEDIWILYGDTLLKDFAKLPVHALATGYIQEHANWGYCVRRNKDTIEFDENFDTNGANVKPVVAGGFHFNVALLIESLRETGDDFMKALGVYAKKMGKQFQTKELTWYDFGHVHSALRSRQTFTTERAFNSMRIEKRRVSKYSTETKKILSEAAWYEGVPRYLDVFLPNYLGRIREEGMFGYATEYLYLNPISDLFVFGRLPEYVWQQILTACKEFLEVCLTHSIPQSEALADIDWLYNEKTVARLARYSAERGIKLDQPWIYNGRKLPSMNKIFADVLSAIPKASNAHLTITHGDFHFANIFFDFRSLCIKAVDPRGLIKDNQTVFGDRRYDLAKLAHSVNGLYDYIIAGLFKAKVDTTKYEIVFDVDMDDRIKKVQRLFNAMVIGGLSPSSREISAIVIILYLSMLPLHADNRERQDTLLANVFRLYTDFIALPLEAEDPHVCFSDGGA